MFRKGDNVSFVRNGTTLHGVITTPVEKLISENGTTNDILFVVQVVDDSGIPRAYNVHVSELVRKRQY